MGNTNTEWMHCNRNVLHSGMHEAVIGVPRLTGCGTEFRDVVNEDGRIVAQQVTSEEAKAKAAEEKKLAEVSSQIGVPVEFLKAAMGGSIKAGEAIREAMVSGESVVKTLSPSYKASRPHILMPEPAKVVDITSGDVLDDREQIRHAQSVLDELGATPDQAMAIILVNIANANDVREEASKWLARFTEDVMAIVNESEADFSTEEAGDGR